MPRLRPPTKPMEPAQRLPAPTPAQIASVTDVLEHRWASNALMAQDRFTQAIERDDHHAANKWAVTNGIATDKILALQGRPTTYVGHIHVHRHELSSVMEKIARSLRRPGVPVASLPLAPVTQVIDLGMANDATQHGHVSPK